ncbi:prephenate dehydrogenase [Capsaspora owczarzaki ATCC 30864]|uniref:Prephenate dehydrogenase n=1 Tax=Capsaspora owczarzaki (strain ATCC 30864) TaxID=595528 RepID=A0A0D2X3C1_CAPO3|nr:prephenate dehydrogenase [Capsaspora owczarzaki ATCC 30864]KJE94049.1 prephenate dehydrogenase [Capsaspora owczarzaki ATCC 30864]|eukprot:XP_004347497.1 prephenate dehydrogenase [Capsaspora owczarzaki ATCC 30864]
MPINAVGIIGMGEMGRLYADWISKRTEHQQQQDDEEITVHCCDVPERYDELCAAYADSPRVRVHRDGFAVVRQCGLVMYSVETANMDRVVGLYGPATRVGAIVAGQTSVKAPEIAAFERHLPSDAHIVTCHSLHGPRVSPRGQTMVVIRHRCDKDDVFRDALAVFRRLESNMVEMSAETHDRITANTQVISHLGFQAMGTAWRSVGVYPWEQQRYLGGIDNVKILMCLRIFAAKPHIYSGLAMQNPQARYHVEQYVRSVSELFRLMIQERQQEFTARIYAARAAVFGRVLNESDAGTPSRSANVEACTTEQTPASSNPPAVASSSTSTRALLLPDAILAEYGLGRIPASERTPNSHLSLLAMVDAWYAMKVNPYDDLVCQTPVFRLRLGIAEYLFCDKELLDESIAAALFNKSIRGDDMEFFAAVREWATIILNGDLRGYEDHFLRVRQFFESRLQDGFKASCVLIDRLASTSATPNLQSGHKQS